MSTEVASDIQLDEITTLECLEALRTSWTNLWMRSPTATPFQSPEWLIPWWKYFGAGDLWTLALRHGQDLVGLAPLFVRTDLETRIRKVLLLGTGITDYLDPLHDSDCLEGVPELLRHIETTSYKWDLCDFQQLQPESLLLNARLPPGLTDETTVQEVCPQVDLSDRGAELSAVIRTSMFHKVQYYRRRAESVGCVQFEDVSEANFDELFEGLLRLHSERWNFRGFRGVLSDRAIQLFHREVACGMLTRGMLRLHGLRLNKQLVAVLYGFKFRQRAYYYIEGFDPRFARLSLGTLMIAHAMEQALREGFTAFDFLRGSESYKYKWGAVDRPNYRRVIRPGVLGE